MLERLEPLYDVTLRRTPVHHVLRNAVWAGGNAAVSVVSALSRFELPAERLLPLYKLQILFGTWEASTVHWCRRLLGPGCTAVDVGAHAGYYTLLFSKLVGPAGRVLAFEPDPDNFALLERNVRRRGLTNAHLFRSAVCERDGEAALWRTALSMGHSLMPIKAQAGSEIVTTVALDTLCERHRIDQVDLVKIDAEGAELEVLRGMRGLASRSPQLSVVLEFKDELLVRRKQTPADWLRSVEELGFTRLLALPRSGETIPVSAHTAEVLRRLGSGNLLALNGAAAEWLS